MSDFLKIKIMRKILALLGIILTTYGTTFSQIPPSAADADPAAGAIALVGGGNQINQTAQVDYTFTNQATVPPNSTGTIPAGALEVTIGFPNEYGLQSGVTPVVANWTVVSYADGPGGQLVLTNNPTIDAGTDLVARVSVVGFTQTASAQTTLNVDRSTPITTGDANAGNNVNSATLGVSAPLPIKLVSFTTQQKSCGVVALDWVTSKEERVSHYEIQYSKDGNQFSSVKRIQAKNDAIGATYSAIIEQAGKEGFYRLKAVDVDGIFTLSHVAKVMLTCEANVISVSPNPATGTFQIAGLETAGEMQLYNIIGQQVLKQQIEAGASKIDITTLPSGNYNLIILDAYGSKTTFKLVKL
ncbi:MAG: T9SS type A sorting domain-containing protein [Sphingobacteriales bacterium]|nr:MAG: T9SS type A sorting domain-containing protein [Sphingobacteriales bacterium]